MLRDPFGCIKRGMAKRRHYRQIVQAVRTLVSENHNKDRQIEAQAREIKLCHKEMNELKSQLKETQKLLDLNLKWGVER